VGDGSEKDNNLLNQRLLISCPLNKSRKATNDETLTENSNSDFAKFLTE